MTLAEHLRQTGHRSAVVLQGNTDWQQQQLHSLCADYTQGVWIGLNHSAPLPKAQSLALSKVAQYLGQETDFVIFDSQAGFDADALGQATGMIRAGGLAIFLIPETGWPTNPALSKRLNHPLTADACLGGFYPYLFSHLRQQPEVTWLTAESTKPFCAESTPAQTIALPTADQQHALEAIRHVAFGHRKRPLLVTADRGRGKSYALGLACLDLIQQGKHHLTLTAARLANVQQAFDAIETHYPKRLSNELKCLKKQPGLVVFEGKKGMIQVQFQAPDTLLQHPIETDILLVDEAAHLPLPMLQQLSQTYSRCVFATTQHGYEGSGRGFQIKFRRFLDAHFPGWKHQNLSQPIRWQAQDPLETLINQVLLLNSDDQPLAAPPCAVLNEEIQYQQIECIHQLPADDLAKLFSLLMQAHYQTRPNDLMQLLELPNQQLWVAKHQNQWVGALLALREGNLETDDWQSRRFQGHLFAQLLRRQTQQSEWAALSSWRVQRLAVSDSYQHQGIGSHLLQHFIEAESHHVDYLSTSFGATSDLLRFWQRNGFQAVHLGTKRDQASGQHSVALCLPCSDRAGSLCQQRQQAFAQQWAWQLPQVFSSLEPDLVLTLLEALPFEDSAFPEGYWQEQPYEAVSFALRQWSLVNPTPLRAMSEPWRRIWIQKVLQNHTWQSLAFADAPSQKTLEKGLKAALLPHLS